MRKRKLRQIVNALQAENHLLQADNLALIEAARAQAFVVQAGGLIELHSPSIGFLWVDGGTVNMGAGEIGTMTITSGQVGSLDDYANELQDAVCGD